MNLTDTFERPREALVTRSHGHWPSGLTVFVKSLHLISAAWIVAVLLVWSAIDDHEIAGANTLMHAVIPALSIETLALYIGHWTKVVGGSAFSHAREWEQALLWAIVPIVFLIGTALLVIG